MRPCKGVQWSWATTRDVVAAVPLAGRYGYLLGPNSFHFQSHPLTVQRSSTTIEPTFTPPVAVLGTELRVVEACLGLARLLEHLHTMAAVASRSTTTSAP
jgi:hypothetical protein